MNAISRPSTLRGRSGKLTAKPDSADSLSARRRPSRAAMIANVPDPGSSMVTPGVPTGLPWRDSVNACVNGEMKTAPPSATQLLLGGIIENRITYFDAYVSRSYWIIGADPLAVTCRSASQEAQADPMLERRR